MKTFIKYFIYSAFYFSGIYLLFHWYYKNKGSSLALCFHNISNRDLLLYPPMKVAVFKKLLNYLKYEFKIVTLDELVEGSESGKIKVALSFDDGEKEFITNVLPLLEESNTPANQNVVVNCISSSYLPWSQRLNAMVQHWYEQKKKVKVHFEGRNYLFKENKVSMFHTGHQLFSDLMKADAAKRNKAIVSWENLHGTKKHFSFMNWHDLLECQKSRIEVGSHTMNHELLTDILDENELMDELTISKKLLEHELKTEISTISFPNGQYNDKIKEQCLNAGYKKLLTTESKYIDKIDSSIPRIPLNSSFFPELIFKLYVNLK